MVICLLLEDMDVDYREPPTVGASGGVAVPFRLLVLKGYQRPLLPPHVGEVSRSNAIMEALVVEAQAHLARSDAMGEGPLLGYLPPKAEVDRGEVAVPDLPLALRCEEVGSSSVATLASPRAGGRTC